WPGGAKGVGKADFRPLQGRQLVAWPDADDAGTKAAHAAAQAGLQAGAAMAGVVELPGALPQAWDLADDWPPGLDAEQAACLIAAAPPVALAVPRSEPEPAPNAGSDVVWPHGMRMVPEVGLFWEEQKGEGEPVRHWISDPFEVVGTGRTPEDDRWSTVVRFRNRDGRERLIPIPWTSLASGGADARQLLADNGLSFKTGPGALGRLSEALMRVRSARRVLLVDATGWVEAKLNGEDPQLRFVLPDRSFGPDGGEPVLFTGSAQAVNYGVAGDLAAWRDGVARPAEGNAALMFALSAAFAGPLLRLLDVEGGGFHFRGNSSAGKSTLLVAAGSVWGGSRSEQSFGHTWRATANALEGLALAHNDGLLTLDEFGQIDAHEAGSAAYLLANGQGKARSKADGTQRRTAKWKLLFLSSGEGSLAAHMASGPRGERAAVGQELRLVDIPADAGKRMGIWETIHSLGLPDLAAIADKIMAGGLLSEDEGKRAGRQLSLYVTHAARANYGHAGSRFLEHLTADREAATSIAREIAAAFEVEAARPGDSAQVGRVARRFAVAAAAGELACSWGLVPWQLGAASRAARALFWRWADAFGRDVPREERVILQALRNFIVGNPSAFGALGDEDPTEDELPSPGARAGEARAMKAAGWRRTRGSEVRFLFNSAGWAMALQGVADLREAAKVMRDAGFLETDTDRGRTQKKVKIHGVPHWVYCVKSELLAAELGD
ncbi:MAG: DUF927 domain-containing protein, partial [Alphaproteobacteria bacterium]|nr:DUF927 domain-containing protein [Alphaproteobacteria bacterium]